MRGAGCSQRSGAGIERRAGGKYIIYQQDPPIVKSPSWSCDVGATRGLPAFVA